MSELAERVGVAPALEVVAEAAAALDDLGRASLSGLSDADLTLLLRETEVLVRRCEAARVAVVRECDGRALAARAGAASTAAWLRQELGISRRAAGQQVRLGHALVEHERVAAAFTAGHIGAEHASAVCDAVDQLPAAADQAARQRVERLLVEQARHEDPESLSRRGRDIAHRFDPQTLEEREQRLHEGRWVSLRTDVDGSTRLAGRLDPDLGAALRAGLDAFAAPRSAVEGIPDARTAGQRHADALADLVRVALAAGDLPETGGTRPQVVVTVPLSTLQAGLASAGEPGRLEDHEALSAAAVRRRACDAAVLPVVLGSASQPLDIGRATRIVPGAMRRALVARDGGCAFPHCDRRPGWCDAHHIVAWADGGPTALGNLVLLCEHHHRMLHHGGWAVAIASHDGRPRFTPPRRLASEQEPRQHLRHRHRVLIE